MSSVETLPGGGSNSCVTTPVRESTWPLNGCWHQAGKAPPTGQPEVLLAVSEARDTVLPPPEYGFFAEGCVSDVSRFAGVLRPVEQAVRPRQSRPDIATTLNDKLRFTIYPPKH